MVRLRKKNFLQVSEDLSSHTSVKQQKQYNEKTATDSIQIQQKPVKTILPSTMTTKVHQQVFFASTPTSAAETDVYFLRRILNWESPEWEKKQQTDRELQKGTVSTTQARL
jgi:hypothetical protein